MVYRNITYDSLEVSSSGVLRNKTTGTVYKTRVANGYECVCVSLGSRQDKLVFKIHRCVAETFIPRIDGKEIINHIDGNKLNNHVNNLEWCTLSENTNHAIKSGAMHVMVGDEHPNSKFTNEEIVWIRENYKPKDPEFGARALALRFNVSHRTICDIVSRKRYACVA